MGLYVTETEEWGDKIRRYTQVSEVQVKPNPKKAAEPAVAVVAEGQQVLKAIAPQVCPSRDSCPPYWESGGKGGAREMCVCVGFCVWGV